MEYKLTRNRDGFELCGCNTYNLIRLLSQQEPGEYTLQWPVTKQATQRRRLSPKLKVAVETIIVSLLLAAIILIPIYYGLVG